MLPDRRLTVSHPRRNRRTHLRGRWNSPGGGALYTAETFSGAVLEVLVHANLNRIPKNHAVITIDIPEAVSLETADESALSEWDAQDQLVSRAFGDRWLIEARTAALMVPSLVTRGREHNLVLNPAHADFPKITHTDPELVIWDARLFLK